MLFPNVLMICLFCIYPLIWVLKYMFFQYDQLHAPIFIGLDNFARVFSRDPYFWKTVVNTFVYVGGKLLLTIPIAFFLALILNRKFKGANVLQSVIFLPTIMSSAVMALVFYLILNPYSGALNQILQKIHLITKPINWLGKDNAMKSVIVVGAWGAIGNYMVYFIAGLQSIPEELYESSALDGITPWQKIRYITIPMLMPVMKIILMIGITSSFQDIQSIMVLTEGGPGGQTDVMFLYIYRMFFPVSQNVDSVTASQFGYGAALSVVSAGIVGLVTIAYLKLTKHMDDLY